VNGANAFIKVVAVDNTGKESFDEAEIIIPTNPTSVSVTWAITPGQTFTPGEMLDTVYTVLNPDSLSRVEYYLEDVRGNIRKMFGRGANGLPFFSTDTARFVVAYGDTTNRCRFFYSPFFTIRPDAHLNDAPPVVTLISPQPGQPLPPNSLVPVTWTASDDEGLRSFDILASYDAGRTWQPVVKDLPGTARSYNWQTPPGTGFASGVRVMVIAKDWRFQSTSDDGTRRPLALVNAVSRKTHGSVGTFDINLPLSGEPGVECRSGGGNYTQVFTFTNNVVSGSAAVTAGTGSISGSPTFSGNTMTVNLTGVTDVQKITVTLIGVTDAFSQVLPSTPASMNVLIGDVNGNKTVNASDVGLVKSQVGQAVAGSNFREDVNADGSLTATDVALTKSRVGDGVP
jgi:hypothetical protein